MSLLEQLYRTYENNLQSVGKLESRTTRKGMSRDITPLLPVGHTSQHAYITITLDGKGNLIKAKVNGKGDTATIMPATEKSSSRTRDLSPHPLCDKLQYVAGDYPDYVSDKKSGFDDYVALLEKWHAVAPEEIALKAILHYVKQKHVIRDLVEREKILPVNPETGKLLEKWTGDKDEAPSIFSLITNGVPADSLVRWEVNMPGQTENRVWHMKNLLESWSEFYINNEGTPGLCYIKGLEVPLASLHPAKLRNPGDGAKIVSANDTSGYTFRGRFIDSSEVCGVSVEISQKAHNALRWLISRQGWTDGSLCILAWSPKMLDIPSPCNDSDSLFGEYENTEEKHANTKESLGRKFSSMIRGYREELSEILKDTDSIFVLGLDSASTGRLAISYFGEFTVSDYFKNITYWHEQAAWPQSYSKDRQFEGAPSPRIIAETAYGTNVDEKLRRQTIRRLLPCMIERGSMPSDIVASCIRRASNPNGIDTWEWKRAIGVACSLYKYQQQLDPQKSMSLDTSNTDRNYLYGRLLGTAERIENYAHHLAGENRPTQAEKLMQRFSERPYSTWPIIEKALAPYFTRIQNLRPGAYAKFKKLLDSIMNLFPSQQDYEHDTPLTGAYLLGYHCQLAELWKKDDKDLDQEDQS